MASFIRKLTGVLGAVRLWMHPRSRTLLRSIIRGLCFVPEGCPQTQEFVLMLGFSKSGKGTFVRNHSQVRRFFRLDSDEIHRRLAAQFPKLRDDRVGVSTFWLRNILTRQIRSAVLRRVTRSGYGIVSDNCNLTRLERKRPLAIAKRAGYRTTIVAIVCPPEVIQERLVIADAVRGHRGETPVWVRLHNTVQRPRFQEPRASEADRVMYYQSLGQDPNSIVI